jgi:thiamine-phosphate pyrophosphorylase
MTVTKNNEDQKAVFRILDANLNRLREALRVIEEYFRFIASQETVTVQLKQVRHSLEEFEKNFGPSRLLASRDTGSDPFANVNRPEEMDRSSARQIVSGNFKRAQEASRVLEEYTKIIDPAFLSQKAKTIRFTLYTLEKLYAENLSDE